MANRVDPDETAHKWSTLFAQVSEWKGKHMFKGYFYMGLKSHYSYNIDDSWKIGYACLDIMKTRLFKYIENFTTKNWKFSDKNSDIFITKNWKFSDKNSDIFHISAQDIYCGYSLEPPRRVSSTEYPQSMSLIRNKKNNVYPCKPQFYYIKVGFKGVKII